MMMSESGIEVGEILQMSACSMGVAKFKEYDFATIGDMSVAQITFAPAHSNPRSKPPIPQNKETTLGPDISDFSLHAYQINNSKLQLTFFAGLV